jgi:two-component system response regulator DevR
VLSSWPRSPTRTPWSRRSGGRQRYLLKQSGYLLKQSEPERLISAVETAAAGGSLLDPAVTDTVLRWMRGTANGGEPSGRLSDQERKILPLIAEGKTNREIGAELYLPEHTVKTYVSSLSKKLQLARRAEAAAYDARQQQQARAS